LSKVGCGTEYFSGYKLCGTSCSCQGTVNCLHRLQEDPPAGVSGAPTENNIMLWNAVIFG